MQETIRSVVARAGHFLPMVLVLALPLGLASAVPTWFALRDVVMISDPEAQTFEVQNFSWSVAMMGLIGINVATMLASFLLSGAASHHVVPTSDDEKQYQWSVSVRHAISRAPRIIGYSFARTLTYLGPTILLGVLIVTVSPAFILGLFMLAPVFAFLWVRLCLVDVSASIGPQSVNPFKASWAMTGPVFFPLLGRLLLLLLIGFTALFMFVILGQPFIAIAGGDSGTVEPVQDIVRFEDILGPSLALLALSTFFSTLGSGFRDIIFAAGGTKLYQRLNGTVDEAITDVAEKVAAT